MSVLELSIMLMLLLFAILGSGVWIALALAVCGFAAVLTKVATPAGQVLAKARRSSIALPHGGEVRR